jgi:MATE family multidrug resistance protein
MAALFLLAGGVLIDTMTTAEGVRAAARDYLGLMALVPILGAASWLLDGVFIGATRTRDMRNMALLSTACFALMAAVAIPIWGNTGLWAAFLGSFVARGITLAIRYPALERATTGGAR